MTKSIIINLKLTIDDIITTDGYIEIAKKCSDTLCQIKTDYFKIGKFKWRGNYHPSIIKENVIISHSDYSVTDEISEKFKKVFCVNNSSKNKNTFSLPLGIPNNSDELEILKIIGNKESLIQVIESDVEKENLLYLNFSVNTYSDLRGRLMSQYKKLNWVNSEEPKYTPEGRIKYLTSLKKSKFVLCPRGNGIDTHRLWETLYVGSIPIIEKFKTHDICHDLPVLFIDDWSALDEDFLNEKYLEITNRNFNLDKLKISFWENFIKEKITNYV
jgi:hypothetical protein